MNGPVFLVVVGFEWIDPVPFSVVYSCLLFEPSLPAVVGQGKSSPEQMSPSSPVYPVDHVAVCIERNRIRLRCG
jgi:hypothetical protein